MENQKPTKEEIEKKFNECLKVWTETVERESYDSTLTVNRGRKYIKVVMRRKADGSGGSVWAFIDPSDGAIYKPAGWASPAKHARGNILTHDPSTMAWTGPHYLRA